MGQTSLHVATKGGHVDVVQILLSAKPNVDIRDKVSMPRIHIDTQNLLNDPHRMVRLPLMLQPMQKSASGF